MGLLAWLAVGLTPLNNARYTGYSLPITPQEKFEMKSKNAVKAIKLIAAGFILAPSLAMADSSALDALKATAGSDATAQVASAAQAAPAVASQDVPNQNSGSSGVAQQNLDSLSNEVADILGNIKKLSTLNCHNRTLETRTYIEEGFYSFHENYDVVGLCTLAPGQTVYMKTSVDAQVETALNIAQEGFKNGQLSLAVDAITAIKTLSLGHWEGTMNDGDVTYDAGQVVNIVNLALKAITDTQAATAAGK
jgi:hypothetical protein